MTAIVPKKPGQYESGTKFAPQEYILLLKEKILLRFQVTQILWEQNSPRGEMHSKFLS